MVPTRAQASHATSQSMPVGRMIPMRVPFPTPLASSRLASAAEAVSAPAKLIRLSRSTTQSAFPCGYLLSAMSVEVSSADDSDEVRRIVDAAWDVLHRSGYDNVKIQVVARLAGVSIGSFYRHFGDQRELMTALLRDELTRA